MQSNILFFHFRINSSSDKQIIFVTSIYTYTYMYIQRNNIHICIYICTQYQNVFLCQTFIPNMQNCFGRTESFQQSTRSYQRTKNIKLEDCYLCALRVVSVACNVAILYVIYHLYRYIYYEMDLELEITCGNSQTCTFVTV